ncbi:Uma2 family endonuclease [Gemmatirosa kalamazoonensis]|nr:Uma2 family endonuclease [Gemmatirosa kalamazoonensis]
MPATHAEWTVDMLDALPDDGQRYEIIDGDLHVTPVPGEAHQDVVGDLYMLLRTYLRGSGVGRPMVSPSDVRRGDRRRNRVQPDVFVVRLVDGRRAPYPYEMSDLLLAVEVPSPSNPSYDYHTKRELYLANGVPEYWVLNAEARNLSRWRGVADPGEVLVEWHPDGMAAPLVIDLPAFFDEAVA